MTQTQSRKKNLFQMNVDLMHGPIFRSLVLFMLPILISNLFQQLYNTVDTMIVGNVLGDTALAAIGSCGAIYELLVGFGLGIGNGLAIVAARAYGAQDEDLLKRTVAGSLVIGLVASLIITTAGFFGLRPLLELLDTPAEILEDAYRYIIIIDLGVIVMFAYNLCAGHRQQCDAAGVPAAQLGAERGAGPVVHCRDGHGRGRCRGGYRDRTGRVGGAVHPLCHGTGAHPHPGPEASGRGPQAVLGPVQPEHLHGPDEQHRVCRFGDLAVRHQRAGHPDHRRTHGGPQAVCLHGYAAHRHGECIRWWSWW